MPDSFSDIIVDLIIVVILIAFIYAGFKKGFFKEFIGFIGTYVSLIIAIRYMSNLATLLYGAFEGISHSIISILSFVIIFVPLMMFFMFLAKKLKVVSKLSFTLGSIDSIMGLVLGLIKGLIILSVCALIISLTGLSGFISKEINASQLYKPILLKRVLPLAYSVAKLIKFVPYKPFKLELKETLNAETMSALDRRGREVIDSLE